MKLKQVGNGTFLPLTENFVINQRVTRFAEVGSFTFSTNIYGAEWWVGTRMSRMR